MWHWRVETAERCSGLGQAVGWSHTGSLMSEDFAVQMFEPGERLYVEGKVHKYVKNRLGM